MKNQIKIIKFFIENKEKKFSILSISKHLNMNYQIAFSEIKKLEKEKIIGIKRLGNSNQCFYNYQFNEKILIAESQRKEHLLRNKDINVIYTRLNEIKNPFYILLVFGSHSQGKETKRSDIDLCIISDNQETKNKASQIIRTISLNIHYLDFSVKEFLNMLKTTEDNVGKEIIRNNVILKGTEQLYEVINYAR